MNESDEDAGSQAPMSALGFPATSITQIARARKGVDERVQMAGPYYEPLRRFLTTRLRVREDVAEELLHEFLMSEVIRVGGPDDLDADGPPPCPLLERYDPGKGRFRFFLMQRLRWFFQDYQRRNARSWRQSRPLSDERAVLKEEGGWPEPTISRVWARTILGRAIRKLKRAYEQDSERHEHWVLFRERTVRPLLRDQQRPGFTEILDSLGLVDELAHKSASNKVTQARRRCVEILRVVVREYVMEDEADIELLDLIACLAGGLKDKDRPAVLRALLARRIPGLSPEAGAARTIGELLHDPAASGEELALLKRYTQSLEREIAKGWLDPVYREPVRVIYFASLKVARLCGRDIVSSRGDEALSTAVDWVLDRKRSWVDEGTRRLFVTSTARRSSPNAVGAPSLTSDEHGRPSLTSRAAERARDVRLGSVAGRQSHRVVSPRHPTPDDWKDEPCSSVETSPMTT